MAFTLYITKSTLKFVPYLLMDEALLRVSDHEFCMFSMPAQEPRNSAAPWKNVYSVPVILKT